MVAILRPSGLCLALPAASSPPSAAAAVARETFRVQAHCAGAEASGCGWPPEGVAGNSMKVFFTVVAGGWEADAAAGAKAIRLPQVGGEAARAHPARKPSGRGQSRQGLPR